MNLALLQPRFARVDIQLAEWEPHNDNSDALQADPAAFVDADHNHATFMLMQQLRAASVELSASIWLVPDWLVQNPDVDRLRIIDRTMYPEAIESIAAWLLRAKQAYGVDVDFVSFNEADVGGISVLLSPDDYVELIRQAGARFSELGLKTKWLLGDCASIGACLDYAKAIWAVEDIRRYLGPFAFHSYDATRSPDTRLTAVGDWATEQGLETRCTEGGWNSELWRQPGQYPTWENAHQLMIAYNRTIKMTKATTFYYWEMMGRDFSLNDGNHPYKAMELLLQLNRAFPAGSQVVNTSPNTNNIVLFAARTPDGGFGVHIVNTSLVDDNIPDEVKLNGLPEGNYQLHVFEESNLEQPPESVTTSNGSVTFMLPGYSVGYLVKTL
ncbi:MAG TPA: hypothetical protein VIV60_09430 [Polyangiaceae bacterium]